MASVSAECSHEAKQSFTMLGSAATEHRSVDQFVVRSSKMKKSTCPAGYGKEGILRSLTSEALVFGEISVGWR
jgi:hypothetical protein